MIALLSDIHSNLSALESVINHAKSRGCDRYISLGDVIGYGAEPGECIDLMISLDFINILGNHDSYITQNTKCSRSNAVVKMTEYQRTILKTHHIDWLNRSLNFLIEGKLMFIHGGPSNYLDQYLYKITSNLIPAKIRWLFSGHTHVQVLADFEDSGYCNPGSVGQPRDGDSRAAYAIINDERIELHRVEYDIDRAVAAMKAAGFDSLYYENLYKGTQIGGRVDKVIISSI